MCVWETVIRNSYVVDRMDIFIHCSANRVLVVIALCAPMSD